jgi:hypothetical protein
MKKFKPTQFGNTFYQIGNPVSATGGYRLIHNDQAILSGRCNSSCPKRTLGFFLGGKDDIEVTEYGYSDYGNIVREVVVGYISRHEWDACLQAGILSIIGLVQK